MQIDSPKIDNILENAAKQNVPAISAAVMSRDSNLYKGHFGFKDLENKNQRSNNCTGAKDTNINNAKWAILFQDILLL